MKLREVTLSFELPAAMVQIRTWRAVGRPEFQRRNLWTHTELHRYGSRGEHFGNQPIGRNSLAPFPPSRSFG